MEKYFLVEQPPLTSKYRLLVDDINAFATIAITRDIDKVLYNRKIIIDDMDITLETYTALSEKGVTSILPIGRYVTIWKISKDETKQEIIFMDYDTEFSFRKVGKQIMGDYFSEELYHKFEWAQDELRKRFVDKFDIVELFLPSAS